MATTPIRIALNGASGRMGQALIGLLRSDARFELAYAVVSPQSAQADAPVWPGRPLRFAHDWSAAPAGIEVVVDFSSSAGLATALDFCLARSTALVAGSTGLDPALVARLDAAASRIPLLRAANFSLGVAVLTRLLREAAAALHDWDLEIVEAHHGRKQDAPSGTALALGAAAAQARGTTLAAAAVYAREGRPGARRDGSIGFAVVRGGDIVGEHQAMLIGTGERIELAHRATDRAIFARGALEAASWLATRPAGAYGMDDVLATRMRLHLPE
ncbi:MAG: 4-hydroxy-tetrahydrodipicolinate reductase [Rhodanobacter sp.]|nr:MAG: 4-hydroxy-tetrahydrodipicolinate reductase [Rhodanobacter sp.]TAM09983.1 MAG: 4-hydroxy-tetrahydrodipicolinate reductase [Rhodanobacter sp.]TAM34678.1 MAG: 4-hydroxy-tetrahydrodipicolinate reductase [Rhodanobacter sp.]